MKKKPLFHEFRPGCFAKDGEVIHVEGVPYRFSANHPTHGAVWSIALSFDELIAHPTGRPPARRTAFLRAGPNDHGPKLQPRPLPRHFGGGFRP